MKGKHCEIVWLDFAGEYSNPILREHKLRLNLQSKSIQRFLKRRVSFIGMSKDIQSYIHGERSLGDISEKIIQSLDSNRKSNIIVTGLDVIRRQTPRNKTSLLDELIIQFINIVPEESTVIWFDRPVPLSQRCQRFDTRCVAPFYSTSPWKYVVDEIVWNLPMAPPRYGSQIPVHDDIRILVNENSDTVEEETILISPLYNWGERFRPDRDRIENITKQNVFYLKGSYSSIGQQHISYYTQEDIDVSFELITHLLEPDESRKMNKNSLTIEQIVVPSSPTERPSLLSFISFTPFQLKVSKVRGKEKPSEERDGRVKRLEPLGNINYPREYRTTRLYVKPPKMTIKPPHISLLQKEKKTELEIARSEVSGIRRTIKLLKKVFNLDKEWIIFLEELNNIVKDTSFNILREVRIFLEIQEKSKSIWNILRPTRSWFSRELNYEQRDAMKKLLHQHPDLLLITGNQYFLLLLAAMYKGGVSEPTTGLIENIWEYLEPWQLVDLGFIPHYHAQHRTGKSVLHRTSLLKVLMNRVQATSKLLEKEHVSEVQFGRVIPVTINKNAPPTALWLVFQSKPASHEMNAFLIPTSDAEDWDVVYLLKSLPREKPYWGKTDLSLLGALAQDIDISYGIPIMIATHKRVRGFWVLGKKHWLPIGRIAYYTIKKETVTLLRSLTLRQDPTMQEIKRNHVRSFPSNLDSSIEMALGTIDAAFRHYQHATCKVSLDKEEKMFKLVFKNKDDSEAGYLLVKRVTNILELLRRPDFECEPVEVNGNKFVWNRFKDIEYKGDTLILRPWVERTNPFKIRSMKLPQTADTFLTVKRLSGLTLGIHHNPSLCPQARLTIKEIENRKQTEDKNSEAYMRKMEGEPSQPEQLLDESIHGHGSCWNISLKSSTSLPENLVELETIKFNGWALGAVFKTGMVIYEQDDEWIFHEFDVPNVENLPREFRESVALVDAYRSIVPKALKDLDVPGTYRLRERELWNVTYTLEYGGLRWSAISLQTQQDYKGTSFSIFLHPEASLDYAYEQVISGITYNIPEESIFQYEELQENLKRDLREHGYRSGKEYELEVSRSNQDIEYEVWLHSPHEWETDGVLSVSESWKFEDIWQELMTLLIEKGLAEDEMMNKLDVQNKLYDLLTEVAPESERGLVEEAKEKSHRKAQNLWNVYIEYSDLSEKYSTLVEKGRVDEALLIIEDILQLLTQESLEDDTTIRTYLVHTLAYKAKILTSDEKSGIVGPSTLLEILDRMHSYIQPGSRYLRSKSEFGKLVRWALVLRDKLRADL